MTEAADAPAQPAHWRRWWGFYTLFLILLLLGPAVFWYGSRFWKLTIGDPGSDPLFGILTKLFLAPGMIFFFVFSDILRKLPPLGSYPLFGYGILFLAFAFNALVWTSLIAGAFKLRRYLARRINQAPPRRPIGMDLPEANHDATNPSPRHPV